MIYLKLRNKIFLMLAIAIISTLAIFTDSVLAVGNVYQSWINVDSNKNRYLLYRTYVTPAEDTVRSYTERVNTYRESGRYNT